MIRAALASFLVVLIASLAAGQNLPANSVGARAVAAQSVFAITKGNPVADVTLSGSITSLSGSDTQTGLGVFQARGLTDSRIDLNLGDYKKTEIRQSSGGYPLGAWIDKTGKAAKFAYHNSLTSSAWFFPALSCLAQSSNPSFAFTDLGPDNRDGLSTRHLRVLQVAGNDPPQLAKLTATDVYLDPVSLLPLAIAFSTHPDDDMNTDISVEIRFADYRPINGILIPFRFQRMLNGSLVLDVTVSNVVLNSGLPDALFNVPPAAGVNYEAH